MDQLANFEIKFCNERILATSLGRAPVKPFAILLQWLCRNHKRGYLRQNRLVKVSFCRFDASVLKLAYLRQCQKDSSCLGMVCKG